MRFLAFALLLFSASVSAVDADVATDRRELVRAVYEIFPYLLKAVQQTSDFDSLSSEEQAVFKKVSELASPRRIPRALCASLRSG